MECVSVSLVSQERTAAKTSAPTDAADTDCVTRDAVHARRDLPESTVL